jgi:mRNA interferase HicA
MKRRELLEHLSRYGCRLLREGAEHSIWENPSTGGKAAIPRHREIANHTARRICRQLDVPNP